MSEPSAHFRSTEGSERQDIMTNWHALFDQASRAYTGSWLHIRSLSMTKIVTDTCPEFGTHSVLSALFEAILHFLFMLSLVLIVCHCRPSPCSHQILSISIFPLHLICSLPFILAPSTESNGLSSSMRNASTRLLIFLCPGSS